MRPWEGLEAGTVIVLDATGAHLLPDETIAGCGPGLAGHLADGTALIPVRVPELATAPVDGEVHRVRALLPLTLEADGDGGFWLCGEDGDGERVPAATAAVVAACATPRADHDVVTALAAAGGPELDDLRRIDVLAVGAEGVGGLERRRRQRARAHLRLHRSLTRDQLVDVDGRTQVIAVWGRSTDDDLLPLGLGYLLAAVRTTHADRFQGQLLVPDGPAELQRLAAGIEPAVFLFSDYVWNVDTNLALTAAVKAGHPDHLVVHGGPSVPGYPRERDDFLATNPGVDVLVHGEGEATFDELLARHGTGRELAGTPGTTVRTPAGPAVGPPRERIADLDTLPSPYLLGVFDDLCRAGLRRFILETNRGCPFGCTFCDWGSATNSRIRTFPLDRVTAEIGWFADQGAELVILADANFGMLPRDTEIARQLVDAKADAGHPERLALSMGKNPNERFHEIMAALTGAELLAFGGLSLQTYDSETLANIDRRNIPAERYDEIWRRLRRDGISMSSEFMAGLPGATRASFRRDLQFAVEREVPVIMHRTILLPNNPMNAPEYRARFAIDADEDGALIATCSYVEDDLRAMLGDYQAVFAADHLGSLRVFLRFAHQRTGRTEVDLCTALADDARRRPHDRPGVRWFLTAANRWGCAPPGWDRFLGEVRDWWVDTLGEADDTALGAVLRAQRAMLPHPSLTGPRSVALDHDVAAWYLAARDAAVAGGAWAEVVPDLSDFGPAVLEVDDPWQVGENLRELAQPTGVSGWDIRSPFRRPGPRGALAAL